MISSRVLLIIAKFAAKSGTWLVDTGGRCTPGSSFPSSLAVHSSRILRVSLNCWTTALGSRGPSGGELPSLSRLCLNLGQKCDFGRCPLAIVIAIVRADRGVYLRTGPGERLRLPVSQRISVHDESPQPYNNWPTYLHELSKTVIWISGAQGLTSILLLVSLSDCRILDAPKFRHQSTRRCDRRISERMFLRSRHCPPEQMGLAWSVEGGKERSKNIVTAQVF